MSETAIHGQAQATPDQEAEIRQLLAAMTELEEQIDQEHAKGEAIRLETARIAARTTASMKRLDEQLVRLAKARSR